MQILYALLDMEESRKDTQVIYEEAIVIYHIIYDHAMSYGVEKCSLCRRASCSTLYDLYI